MHATAGTMRTTLDTAWAQHVQILNKSILEPATELGNKVAIPFQTDISTWNQSMLECYNALYALAYTLDGVLLPCLSKTKVSRRDFRGRSHKRWAISR